MAANESSKYTNFSNVSIGTANGGGGLKVAGTALTATMAEVNAAADKSAAAVIAATDDVTLTQATHAGKIVTIGSADGDTVTLPAASGTGDVYTIIVAATVTSNDHIIQVANATDIMYGFVVSSADNAASTAIMWAATANDDTITLDGSTTGGLIGDRFVLTDMASGVWQVTGFTESTGTEATPFSAAVS